MLHWRFHFDDQIPVNCLLTKSKRAHIAFWTLKLKCAQNGLYGQSGLQECKVCFTLKLFQNRVEWTIIYRRNLKFSYLVYKSCLEVPDRDPSSALTNCHVILYIIPNPRITCIALFGFITMFFGIDKLLHKVSSFTLRTDYSTKYCQSHRTLLWICIILCVPNMSKQRLLNLPTIYKVTMCRTCSAYGVHPFNKLRCLESLQLVASWPDRKFRECLYTD